MQLLHRFLPSLLPSCLPTLSATVVVETLHGIKTHSSSNTPPPFPLTPPSSSPPPSPLLILSPPPPTPPLPLLLPYPCLTQLLLPLPQSTTQRIPLASLQYLHLLLHPTPLPHCCVMCKALAQSVTTFATHHTPLFIPIVGTPSTSAGFLSISFQYCQPHTLLLVPRQRLDSASTAPQ
ncbi:hypothetical protein TcWFU_002806 [Taenia crassiceps]|uniref:Uncharacterized protein n=1 Tax=Taenia crassiceps TaxID=6207 RepID=A0ABR4QGH1_9CEST